MDKISRQESDPGIKKVSALLKSVTVPHKEDHEWTVMANEIFSALDNTPVHSGKTRLQLPLPDFLKIKPSVAFAVATALVLAALSFQISFMLFIPKPLPNARVVTVQGAVTSGHPRGRASESTLESGNDLLSLPVREGEILETGKDGSCIIALEENTGIALFENSRVEITHASAGKFSAFLEKGTILARVPPPRKGKRFTIVTPNAECHITGTIFKVQVEKDPVSLRTKTTLSVIEGTVQFRSSIRKKMVFDITEGEFSVLEGSDSFATSGQITENRSALKEALQVLAPLDRAVSPLENSAVALSSDPPGAAVFIDGEYTGKTPLYSEFPAGNHTLTFSYLNYYPCDTILTVTADKSHSMTISLERAIVIDSVKAQTPEPVPQKKKKRGFFSLFRKEPEQKPVPPAPKPASISKHPEFIKAMNDLQFGRYTTAIERLRSLALSDDISSESKVTVLEKMALCHKKNRQFDNALTIYNSMYEIVGSGVKKDNLLWEIITIKIDRLQDYAGAEMDLVEYLIAYPDGLWLFEAYVRLAEMQYLLDKPEAAARTYKKHVEYFSGKQDVHRSIYALAQIYRTELDNCSEALKWYTKLISEYPQSTYKENSVFWRAECFSRLGRSQEAKQEYQYYLSHFPQGRWKEAAAARMQAR
ncbi:MAG: PEGA domain-containing protein [Chitinivibrionales bacterium]|nr:PEGA domain-containing protein [Chitinivibrionales bacterium]